MKNGCLDHLDIKSLFSFHLKKKYDIFEVGVLAPNAVPTGYLGTGQVGYFLSNLKSISEAHIGDTFYAEGKRDKIEPLPGYEPPTNMVFAGIYSADANQYEDLESAIQNLMMQDLSISMEYEQSSALGSGFRCGFLGMLHMDVFKQRLKDEFDVEVIITTPSVTYECILRHKNEKVLVENPMAAPRPELISYWKEAICETKIMTPIEYMSDITSLMISKRGLGTDQEYINEDTVILTFEVPLAELISNCFDQLKNISQGYASLEYKVKEYRRADIVKVVFYLNGDPIDALTFLYTKDKAKKFAQRYADKLKNLLPMQ